MFSFKPVSATLLAVGITACGALAPQEQQPIPETIPVVPATAPALKVEYQQVPDLVYGVLAGEVATQRDRFDQAHPHYLAAARLSSSPELAELATKAALAAKDLGAAMDAANYWLQLKPDDLSALQIAALIEAQRGNLDPAADKLRRVVDLQNASAGNGYLLVATLLTKVADKDMRLQLMRRLAGPDNQDPDALLALAVLEAGMHHFAEAEQLARRVLAARPDSSEAKAFLVRMLTEQDKKAEARAALEQFLKESPEDGLLRGTYARLLLEQEDLTAAREQFRQLLKERPGEDDVLFALGVLSLELKDLADARQSFETLYAGKERRSEAAYYLGQVEELEGSKDKALAWYLKADGKRRFEAQLRAARLRGQLGDLRLAREMIQQLRGQTNHDLTELTLVEAEILRDAKQYPLAVGVLDEALAKKPEDADLLYTRAMVGVAMGRLDILERDLQQILKKDPNHGDALNALGYTLADQTDRYPEALGYIERALAQKPDSPAFLDSMGWIQYRLGNRDQALTYLRRAYDLLKDGEIAAHLGEVLWVNGQRDEALQVWDGILAKDPKSEHVLKAKERFQVP